MLRTVLIALGLLFATAGSAGAATLSVPSWSDGPYGPGNPSGARIYPVYAAAPGEHNDLSVTYTNATGTLTFHDAGAPIQASWHYDACTVSTDGHTATCPAQYASMSLRIDLGDEDDAAHVTPGINPGSIDTVQGGAGDDTIESDGLRLAGGPGDDTLTATGSPGATIDGGTGDDHLTGGTYPDLMAGGPGDDLVDGAGGSDSLYDGTPEDPTDVGRDTLVGGPGNDQLYARGGVDTLTAGDGNDTIFAADAVTAAGSSTVATPDVVDCGPGDDAGLFDGPDATTACESVHLGCDGLKTSPWIDPVGPCPRPLVADLPVPTAATTTAGTSTTSAPAAAPAAVPAAPAPTSAAPATTKPAPAPLTAKLQLSIGRARPPLTVIPRALITLSATANVTITYARLTGSSPVALPGTIARRIGGGAEKNISLVVLLGGRQKFVPGRYRITVAATTSDGRTATASALIRMLPEKAKKPKRKKVVAKRHR
jgi:hypothetical protein